MTRAAFLGSLVMALAAAGCAMTPTTAKATEQNSDVQFAQQYKQSSFAHAMRAPSEDAGQARMRINAWVRFNLQRALDYKAQGSSDAALFHLHSARYTLRCATAPLANDEYGNPAVYRGQSPMTDSGKEAHTWRDKVDQDVERMFASGTVPAGDLLMMYGIDTPKGPIDRPGQLPRVNYPER